MTSSEQFRWIKDNTVRPITSKVLGVSAFPEMIHLDDLGYNRTLTVKDKDGNPCYGIFCTRQGQRAYIASVEGYIERAVLSMMFTDDALHEAIYAADTPSEVNLGESHISVARFSDPYFRADLSSIPRQRWVGFSNNFGPFSDFCLFPYNFLAATSRNHEDYKIVIFQPSVNHGTWQGEMWTPYADINAGTLFDEVTSDSIVNVVANIRSVLLNMKFAKHMTTDAVGTSDPYYCTNDICAAISEVMGIPLESRDQYGPVIESALFGDDNMYQSGADGVLMMACITGADHYQFVLQHRQPLAEIFDMGSRYNAYSKPITRLSGFHWSAAVACLDRLARWGACGWEQTYTDPVTNKETRRVQYPNQYASRTVSAWCGWNEQIRDFEASYSNAPALFGNTVWEDEAKCRYWESTNEAASGSIEWSKLFTKSLFQENFTSGGWFDKLLNKGVVLNMNAEMPTEAENFAGVRRADFGVMHVPAGEFIEILNEMAQQFEMIAERGGGTIEATKNFTATLPSNEDDPRVDMTGLDQFPCRYAVDNGYVLDDLEHVYGIGIGKYYKTLHELEPQIDPDTTFFNILKGTATLDGNRKSSLENSMRTIVARFGADIEIALSKMTHQNTVRTRDSILNWINSFEYGNGTAQQFIDAARASKAQGTYNPTEEYFDVYFRCVQNNGRWEPVEILNFYGTWKEVWEDSADYRRIAIPHYTVEYGAYGGCYRFASKSVEVSIAPNRTEEKEAYSLYAQIAQWFGSVDWAWKAMAY